MAEPKKRLTSTRSGGRRSHLYLRKLILTYCPKCNSPALPHRICLNCGYYKGQDILKFEEKTKAKDDRRKRRDEALTESLKEKK